MAGAAQQPCSELHMRSADPTGSQQDLGAACRCLGGWNVIAGIGGSLARSMDGSFATTFACMAAALRVSMSGDGGWPAPWQARNRPYCGHYDVVSPRRPRASSARALLRFETFGSRLCKHVGS